MGIKQCNVCQEMVNKEENKMIEIIIDFTHVVCATCGYTQEKKHTENQVCENCKDEIK